MLLMLPSYAFMTSEASSWTQVFDLMGSPCLVNIHFAIIVISSNNLVHQMVYVPPLLSQSIAKLSRSLGEDLVAILH